jgi:hypothetical protein
VLSELGRWGADRLRLPADPSEIPPRVPLTSLLLGGAPYPRQANGEYEIRVGEETVRVAVDAGQIHAAPDSEPDTTIELTRPGMSSLILGARASEIEQTGDLSIHGNRDPPTPSSTPSPDRRVSPACARNSKLAAADSGGFRQHLRGRIASDASLTPTRCASSSKVRVRTYLGARRCRPRRLVATQAAGPLRAAA